MKIAFYICDMNKGGAQRVVTTLIQNYLKRGDEILLINVSKGDWEYPIPQEVKRVFMDLSADDYAKVGRVRRGYNVIKRCNLLRDVLKKEKPDCTVAFMGKTNIMLLLSSRFLPGKFYVSVRATPKEEYYNRALRFCAKTLFSWADGIILQTEDARAFFPKYMRKRTVILPNPLNEAFLRPRYEGERKKRIVTVGRIDENKNQRLLLNAYRILYRKHPEFEKYEMVFYGKGDMLETLKEETVDWEPGTVSFPGLISDIPAAIEDASLYVLTSKTEGMPNSLMEAMALGLPVISTDCPCGGPRALIRDGVNGRLTSVDDAEQLADIMYEVLSNPDKADAMGKEAGKLQQDCAPDAVAQMWRNYICAE